MPTAEAVRGYVFGRWAFEPRRLLDLLAVASVEILGEMRPRLADVADPRLRAEADRVAETRLRGNAVGIPREEPRAVPDVQQVLVNARHLAQPYPRVNALLAAARLGFGDARDAILEEALEVASDIPSDHWRAIARAQIARLGSARLVRRALDDAQQIESSICRLHAIIDVLPSVAIEQREEVVLALLETSWATGDRSYLGDALVWIVGEPTSGFIERVLDGASRVDAYPRLDTLRALAPYLSSDQVDRYVVQVLTAFDMYPRSLLVETFGQRMSTESADEALRSLGDLPRDEWQRRNWADAAAILVPRLSSPALNQLLASVAAVGDAYVLAKVVLGIVMRGPATDSVLGLALAAIRCVEWGYWRNDLLFRLLAMEPNRLLPEAVEIVRDIADPGARIAGIRELLERTPAAQHSELLDVALTAAEAIRGESEQPNAIVALAPHLGQPQLQRALNRSRQMPAWSAWRVLAALAPCLDRERLTGALELAQRFEAGEYQAKALIAVAVRLAEPRRSAILLEALRSAQLGSVESVAPVAAELVEHIPDELLRDVVSLARSVRWPGQRAGVLLALAARVGRKDRSALLMEALAAARQIDSAAARSERAAALAEIAWLSSEPARSDLFKEAVVAACAWEHSEPRNAVLAAIAERYGPEPGLDAIERLLPPGDYPDQYSASRLAADLPSLALVEQRTILELAVELLRHDTHLLEDGWTYRWQRLADGQPVARPQAYLWIIRWEPGGMGPGPTDSGLAFVADSRPLPRVVNTGFASNASPVEALDPSKSLRCGQRYYFWVEVGPPVAESIEVDPTPLPEELPPETTLTVAIFGFDREIQVFRGADVGELMLHADGTVDVARQPTDIAGVSTDSWLSQHRLLFPIQVPERVGTYRLRCSVYSRGLLVQSRLVSVRATSGGTRSVRALRSTLDYTLASRLDPAQLADFAPHDLSLMFNTNDGSTHGLRVVSGSGDEVFKSDANIDASLLEDVIGQTRGALQRASWGHSGEWQEGQPYLYGGAPDFERANTDLIRFARWGYRLYDVLINRMTGGPEASEQLGELMREHRVVQVALKQDARLVIPAAMIYDRVLDSNADLCLCPEFEQASKNGAPLADLTCFSGGCVSIDDDTVVCPGGFWGYRHALGMPLSIDSAPDAPGSIVYSVAPELAVSVSTDPDLVERVGHERALKGLRTDLGWAYAANRPETLQLLKTTRAQVVYFYCHGGVHNNIPYILVGYGENGITRDIIRAKRIRWVDPRPLVFINGCHTTAVRPEMALDFVSAFVENARASGVVGTEITVFEQLATRFGEECLRRLLEGLPIGEAIRQSRLALLEEANPLGLAYIPFAVASLRVSSVSHNG